MVCTMAPWDSLLNNIALWISSNGWATRPASAVFISLTSITIGLFSTLVTKLLVDTKSLNEKQQKVMEWNRKRKEAMETANRKLWIVVKRQEDSIKKLQTQMMTKRMAPMLVTFIPFLIIFSILRRTFQGHYYAWLPFNIGNFPWLTSRPWSEVSGSQPNPPPDEQGEFAGYSKLSFTFWYFLNSFAFGSLIGRIFGTTATPTPTTDKKKKLEKQRKSNK